MLTKTCVSPLFKNVARQSWATNRRRKATAALFRSRGTKDGSLAMIVPILPIARERAMPDAEIFDALLRMDRTFRAMPRAKAQLAYRPEALAAVRTLRVKT